MLHLFTISLERSHGCKDQTGRFECTRFDPARCCMALFQTTGEPVTSESCVLWVRDAALV
ncbi:MAG: hypothetical protein PVJ65_06970 [Chromatiales bacterium]|jgi:hypothetical protein